jgi:AcrR family transcriptional regulator
MEVGMKVKARLAPKTRNYSNWRVFDRSDMGPVLSGALRCFIQSGYHGTTIREIADASGLSVPGVYHYFESKHAILDRLDREAMEELWERSQAALAEGGDSLVNRFDRLVECLVLFHAYRSELAFISFSEIRSLDGQARQDHIAARNNQQRLLNEILDEGHAAGDFHVPYPRDAARAITNICVGVSQWFRREGSLTPEELAKRYVVICRMTAGAAQT